MRVQCKTCGRSWLFNSRKPSWKLKRDYPVRCPNKECRDVVFIRRKTVLKVARDGVTEV